MAEKGNIAGVSTVGSLTGYAVEQWLVLSLQNL